MDDLINREETLKAMDTWDKFGYDAYGRLFPLRSQDELHLYVPYVHYADMVNAVKGMPPAQKTGHWIPWKAYYGEDRKSWSDELKCSECGYKWGDEEYKYCPSCGCRMVGEEE